MKLGFLHDRLLLEQEFVCHYCGHAIARVRAARKKTGVRKSTIDHVVPKSKGGSNGNENLVAACASCNRKKGGRPIEEFLQEQTD